MTHISHSFPCSQSSITLTTFILSDLPSIPTFLYMLDVLLYLHHLWHFPGVISDTPLASQLIFLWYRNWYSLGINIWVPFLSFSGFLYKKTFSSSLFLLFNPFFIKIYIILFPVPFYLSFWPFVTVPLGTPRSLKNAGSTCCQTRLSFLWEPRTVKHATSR